MKRAILSMLVFVAIVFGKTIFVSAKSGDDKNAGTKDASVASIERGIKLAENFDTLLIAEGIYSGKDGNATWKISKNISIVGSVQDKTFEHLKCGTWCTPTIIQRNPESKYKSEDVPMLFFENVSNILLQGIIFDAKTRNRYDRFRCLDTISSPAKPVIVVNGDSNIFINNCVIANGAGEGIRVSINSGVCEIKNCLIFNVLRTGIEAISKSDGAKYVFSRNEILFVWRSADKLTSGISLDSLGEYEIFENKIGYCNGMGVLNWWSNRKISLYTNEFFSNGTGDYMFRDLSGRRIFMKASSICDSAVFVRCEENVQGKPKTEFPKALEKAFGGICIAPAIVTIVEPFAIKFELEPKREMKLQIQNPGTRRKNE